MRSTAMVVDRGRYAGYTIEVGPIDYPMDVHYAPRADNDQVLLRVHFRISRLPSQRSFVLRHLTGATDADRRQAERVLDRLPHAFAVWERIGAVARSRWTRDPSKWIFAVLAGSVIDDPTVQLELEMMIDADATAVIR